MGDPAAAVRELSTEPSANSASKGRSSATADGRFLDHPSLFPVLQKAAELGVPLYLHPGLPTETLRREHFEGFSPSVSYILGTAAWGWHAETGLHALRMIAARIFDRLPDLQIIIGHMGEMLPFMLARADEWLTPAARRDGLERSVADTFRSNFWVTTSGMFTAPPFQLLQQMADVDRLLRRTTLVLIPRGGHFSTRSV